MRVVSRVVVRDADEGSFNAAAVAQGSSATPLAVTEVATLTKAADIVAAFDPAISLA